MSSGVGSTWSSAMLDILNLLRGLLSLTSKQLPVFSGIGVFDICTCIYTIEHFSSGKSLRLMLAFFPAKSTFLGTVLLFLWNLNIHPLFHSIGFEKHAFYTCKNNRNALVNSSWASLLIKPELHSEIRSYRRESKFFWLLNQISVDTCIGNSMICSDVWHKYREWYFEIVVRNFTSR